MWTAWQRARRGKQPSQNQLRFEARWLDRLQQLTATQRAGAWRLAATVAFVVRHPKTREIHAPDFADWVMHHLLVEQLQTFLRQRENMPGQHPAGGWYVHSTAFTAPRFTVCCATGWCKPGSVGSYLSATLRHCAACATPCWCAKWFSTSVTPPRLLACPRTNGCAMRRRGAECRWATSPASFFANVYLNERVRRHRRVHQILRITRGADSFNPFDEQGA